MARPIKETPILTGSDAKRFERKMADVNSGKVKASKEAFERAMKSFGRVRVIS